MNERQKTRLISGMKQLNISMNASQLEQFEKHLALLLEWNQKMNLTALSDPDEMITHHFLDSATCSLHSAYSKCNKILDLGTGAGFPGIPLKILFPEQEFVLMDSLRKRIDFLEQVKKDLNLEKITMIHARAEDAGREQPFREQFDGIVSRAVATLPVLLEYTIPFLKKDGWFFCQKGPQWQDEVEKAQKAMQVLSVKLEGNAQVHVPFTDLKHQLLVFRKTAVTQKTYPRKAGTPSKKPIQ